MVVAFLISLFAQRDLSVLEIVLFSVLVPFVCLLCQTVLRSLLVLLIHPIDVHQENVLSMDPHALLVSVVHLLNLTVVLMELAWRIAIIALL